MAEEIVRILKVDTQNSSKSINDLRKDIKSLKSELDKAVVGSQEFDDALVKLTQAQKEYNNIQKQVRDMSATNQQNMVTMAGFAKNLAKSYSALNAAIGLFTDGNEDVQKSMLKVQRMIQLIQGLSGIQGLVRDIPKVINSFKSWFTALDPIEKRVNNIAKEINGIDPKKLQAINEANRAGGAGGGTNVQTVNTQQITVQTQAIQDQNQAIAEQGRMIIPVNEQWDKYNKELLEGREILKTWRPEMQQLFDIFEEYNKHTDVAKVNMKEFNKATKELVDTGNIEPMRTFFEGLELDTGALNETAKALGHTYDSLVQGLKNLEGSIIDDSEAIRELQKNLSDLEAQMPKAVSGFKKLGNAIKSVLATVGWTLLITAIIGAIFKLIEYIKNVKVAALEQEKLNKAINELANQSGAKAVVVLKELAVNYAKLGDNAKAKQKFLEDFADKIKETGLAVDTVNEADDVFINNTPKYVAAIMARAKAQATEQKAIELYKEYLDERHKLETGELKWWQSSLVKLADLFGLPLEAQIRAFKENNIKNSEEALKELDKQMEEQLQSMFDSVAEFEKEYVGIFAELESVTSNSTKPDDTTDWSAEYQKYLEALKKYAKDRLSILQDERTKELEAAKDAYDQGLKQIQENYDAGVKAAQGNAKKIKAVEEAKNTALKMLEITYEREVADIIKKYRDKALEDAEKAGRDRIEQLQKEIEQIRRMNDTSNLRAPQQQNVETQYNQPAITAMLGLGAGWTNTYQSGADIQAQYDAQVKYNNDVYMLTYQRITQENELLNQQLQIEQLTADERFNIERTLFENQIALNDALNENYEANNEAFIQMQNKKQQAMNATLSVSSNLMGAMATMFKTESQNQKKSEKERQDALTAYKAFAVTQAIINTFQGANEAYTSMASIPYVGPALGIAAAVAAIAMGIANVHSILSESISTSSTSAAQTTAPAAIQTAPIEYTRQLVGDSELDEMNQPIKCYVLESDITSTQNKVAVTESNASF